MPLYSLDGRRPTLPPEGFFWIAPNASVIGDVVVGLDVGIWFGAVLRGDNEPINIGARTNIQESCTLHTDMGFPLSIGEECTIGHNAILHGCAIGEGSLIGMGAIVLNGARIGRGLPGRRRRACDRRQGLRRPFSHRGVAGQSDPDAGQGGGSEAASVRRALCRQLAPFALGMKPIDRANDDAARRALLNQIVVSSPNSSAGKGLRNSTAMPQLT